MEYKSVLSLSNRSQRGEALKDLTGMGNGGGGTILFGITEDPTNDDLPGAVQLLTVPGVLAQLDAIVRDGVRPPLLSEIRVTDWPGGFLLAVEVLKSQLGPYMIEGYGEHRYYRRANRSTIPMSEQEARDAYALASRWRSSRQDVWREYGLPTPVPEGGPWLTVSVVPEAPFHDLIDPSTTHRDQLRLPDDQFWILEQGAKIKRCVNSSRIPHSSLRGYERVERWFGPASIDDQARTYAILGGLLVLVGLAGLLGFLR